MISTNYINMCIETINYSLKNVKQEQIFYKSLEDYLDTKEKSYFELLKNREIYLQTKREYYLNLLKNYNKNE